MVSFRYTSQEPSNWPAGFYWYGKNRLRRGGVPRWLNRILSEGDSNGNGVKNASPENNDTPEASVDDQDDVEEDQETTTKDVEDDQETTTKGQDDMEENTVQPEGRGYNLRRHIRAPD